MAKKKLLIGLLAVMLVLGGCPESEESVKDDGKDAPKTVKYESTDTAGKTYIFIITVSGSGVAEGDTYVITIKEAGQPDKVITGTVSSNANGTLTLKQNGSEEPLSVTVGNGQMTAINGPIAVEGGEPITAPGPLTPSNNNNNNNNGGGEINTGGNWLQRKEINYKVDGGEASVSSESNYNWIIYRMTSNMDYEQKYTYTSTGSSGTTTTYNVHYIVRVTSNTNYEQTQTQTSTTTDSSGTMTYQSSASYQQIRNGQTGTSTQTSEVTYSDGRFQKQTQTYTIEFDATTGLDLRYAGTVTTDSNIPGYTSGTQTVERTWTIELLSDTGGIKTYKYHRTSEDEGNYIVYKYQNGRRVEYSEYNNGVLSYTTTYDNNGREVERKNYSNGVLRSTNTTTYNDNETIKKYNVGDYDEYTETETRVTIKEGLNVTTESKVYKNPNTNDYWKNCYSETVTVLSDTGSEVVVRMQRLNYGNGYGGNKVLTKQTDTTYRK